MSPNVPTPPVLHAVFNPLIRPYLVVTIGFTIAITIVFLPLAVIWFCGVGQCGKRRSVAHRTVARPRWRTMRP